MLVAFGSGRLFATVVGAANPTPRQFGVLQDCQLSISKTLKKLLGTYQFPIQIASGECSITGKAKFAQIRLGLLNDLFIGGTSAAGQTLLPTAPGEAWTIPATPFQVTVTNAATFQEDLGVIYANTGLPLTRVASAPATGQYSVVVATGIYTFAAADTGLAVAINYRYSTAAAPGATVTWANPVQGTQQAFSVVFTTNFVTPTGQGGQLNWRLNNAISDKFDFPSKLADWNIFEFDFEGFADASNNLMTISMAEA